MRAELRVPAFDQPWHADLFAVTVCLNEQGHFLGASGRAGSGQGWRAAV